MKSNNHSTTLTVITETTVTDFWGLEYYTRQTSEQIPHSCAICNGVKHSRIWRERFMGETQICVCNACWSSDQQVKAGRKPGTGGQKALSQERMEEIYSSILKKQTAHWQSEGLSEEAARERALKEAEKVVACLPKGPTPWALSADTEARPNGRCLVCGVSAESGRPLGHIIGYKNHPASFCQGHLPMMKQKK